MEIREARLMEIRERYALAVISGEGDRSQLLRDLHEAGEELEAIRSARALREYRNGSPVWVWPKTAPWSGF